MKSSPLCPVKSYDDFTSTRVQNSLSSSTCAQCLHEGRLTSDAQVNIGDLVAADAVHAQHGAGAVAAAGQRAQLRARGVHLRGHGLQRRQRLLQVRLAQPPWEAVILHTFTLSQLSMARVCQQVRLARYRRLQMRSHYPVLSWSSSCNQAGVLHACKWSQW